MCRCLGPSQIQNHDIHDELHYLVILTYNYTLCPGLDNIYRVPMYHILALVSIKSILVFFTCMHIKL